MSRKAVFEPLTKAAVRGLTAGDGKQVFLWDSRIPGLGVRAMQSGVKSFILDYRVGTRRRRVTLGRVGELTLDQARAKAAQWRLKVHAGDDPKAVVEAKRAAPTLADLRTRFMAEHAPKRSASTVRNYELLWRKLDHLDARPVAEMRWEDIAAVHTRLADRPYLGNRLLALVSKAIALAKRWDWYPRQLPNPGREHDRHPERKRGIALDADALYRLGQAIDAEESSPMVAALRVVLFTGARPAEVCGARWKDLDDSGRVVSLPETKTGPRALYLGRPAAEIVAKQIRVGRFIFPGRDLQKPISGIRRRLWYRIRDRAGLPETVRLYDLRHTWATMAEELGVSEDRRRRLTGHSVAGVHAGYIHVRDQVLQAEADRVAGAIEDALEGRLA